jgi:hypothetical protein
VRRAAQLSDIFETRLEKAHNKADRTQRAETHRAQAGGVGDTAVQLLRHVARTLAANDAEALRALQAQARALAV